MSNESSTRRDAELRRILVARASARPRRAARAAVAAIGSLAAAGALVAVVVVVASPTLIATLGQSGNEEYDFGRPAFLYDDAEVLGEPVQFRSQDSQIVDLGEPPAEASELGMTIRCFTAGTYTVTVLDVPTPYSQPVTCDDDAGVTRGGLGGYIPFPTSGAARVEISATAGGEYAIWLAWIDKPADPEPSAEQTAALADGVVTREEYLAGFDRFAACMSTAGFDVGGNRDTEIIQYSLSDDAVRSGVEHQCYGAEFLELDRSWQIAHPQRSEEQGAALIDGVTREEYLAAFDRYADCMADLGVTVQAADRDAEVLDYTLDVSHDLSAEASHCYRFEFFDVDLAWRASLGE